MLAIILSCHDFRENDKTVSLYSLENGKIEAVATGAKKIISKNAAYLEPCSFVEIEIEKGKEFNRITKVVGLDYHKNIRTNFDKIIIAKFILKVFDRVVKEQSQDSVLFKLLYDFLEYLDKNNIKDKTKIIDLFFIKFLQVLGVYNFSLDIKKWSDYGILKQHKLIYEKVREILEYDVGDWANLESFN